MVLEVIVDIYASALIALIRQLELWIWPSSGVAMPSATLEIVEKGTQTLVLARRSSVNKDVRYSTFIR